MLAEARAHASHAPASVNRGDQLVVSAHGGGPKKRPMTRRRKEKASPKTKPREVTPAGAWGTGRPAPSELKFEQAQLREGGHLQHAGAWSCFEHGRYCCGAAGLFQERHERPARTRGEFLKQYECLTANINCHSPEYCHSWQQNTDWPSLWRWRHSDGNGDATPRLQAAPQRTRHKRLMS